MHAGSADQVKEELETVGECKTVLKMTNELDRCSGQNGTCVRNEADCKGVIRGPCGPTCGCCIAGCQKRFVGDGECDDFCNEQRYSYDGGDCGGTDVVQSACPAGWRGNGKCEVECNNEMNSWDSGDCGDDKELDFKLCPPEWVGNHKCDEVCNNLEYSYDGGDCVDMAPDKAIEELKKGCPASLDEIEHEADASDASARHCLLMGGTCVAHEDACVTTIKGVCTYGCGCCTNSTCKDKWRGDGNCDVQCNTAEHAWDGALDCTAFASQ